MRAVLLGCAVAGALLTTAVPARAAAPVTVQRGVVYGTGATGTGPARLLLDLYRPAERVRRTRPVVVLIHGGGFVLGARTDPAIVRVARGLAGRGIAVASIDYRLQPAGPVPSARVAPLTRALPDVPISKAISAATDDTLAALAYLRGHARRLRLDPARIGLVGSSAGAITADHVAYALDDHGIRAPRVRFVASLWGGIVVAPPAALGTAPALQLERGEAPLFAVHGDADPTVKVTFSDDLVARARRARVRVEYHRIAGGRHGYDASGFFTRRVAGGQTPYDRLLRFAARELGRR